MLVQLNKESPMLNHGDQIIYLKSFTPRPSLLAKPNPKHPHPNHPLLNTCEKFQVLTEAKA
jgi:hypothetical protein